MIHEEHGWMPRVFPVLSCVLVCWKDCWECLQQGTKNWCRANVENLLNLRGVLSRSIVVHTDSYLSNGWDIRAHPSRRNKLCGNSLLNYCIFTVYLGEHGWAWVSISKWTPSIGSIWIHMDPWCHGHSATSAPPGSQRGWQSRQRPTCLGRFDASKDIQLQIFGGEKNES